ncbi:hypothetical protein MHYP_G00011510 [Metynnis hypsauchen]
MRADGNIEVPDEVISGKRGRENEWEEWVDLGLEIDELRSNGEGEEGEPRLLPGTGQAEVALAHHLTQCGLCIPGLEQLAVHDFAQAILKPVRVLGENSGVPGDMAVLTLYGKQFWRAGAEGQKGCCKVLDPVVCKRNAVKHYA